MSKPIAASVALSFAALASALVYWHVMAMPNLHTSDKRINRESIVSDPVSNVVSARSGVPSRLHHNLLSKAIRLDPETILRDSTAPDPALLEWVIAWKRRPSIPPPDMQELLHLLAQCPLSAVDFLDLARAMRFLSGDLELGAQFYEFASRRVAQDLALSDLSDDERFAVVDALHRNLDDYKRTLWPMIEERRQIQYAHTLYRLYSSFVRFAPEVDPRLLTAIPHPAIGATECLYKLDRSSEALALLDKMSPEVLTTGELNSFAWIYGLTLYDAHRWGDAAKWLRAAMRAPKFPFRQAALRMIVFAHASAGDAPAARQAYHEFAAISGSDTSSLIELSSAIAAAGVQAPSQTP